MNIKRIEGDFTVCKVIDDSQIKFNATYCFTGKTEEEYSLVCLTEDTPNNTIDREDGWKAFRVEGTLDFSLVGILANISKLLSDEKIPIFVVSTFNTDYVFMKEEHEMAALGKLARNGYKILTGDSYGDYFMNRTASDIMSEFSEQEEEWK